MKKTKGTKKTQDHSGDAAKLAARIVDQQLQANFGHYTDIDMGAGGMVALMKACGDAPSDRELTALQDEILKHLPERAIKTFTKLCDAFTDESFIGQQAAFLLGREVGRRIGGAR